MKPEAAAKTVLSTTRARAKMHEFKIGEEFHNQLTRDPQMLFALAVGILSDVAAAISDAFTLDAEDAAVEALPPTWAEDDGSPDSLVRFSATFFDSYLEARLDSSVSDEFSVLAATAYYLSDSVGSAAVVVKRADRPKPELADGLAALLFQILENDFTTEGRHAHSEFTDVLTATLRDFFDLKADRKAVAEACRRLREWAYAAGSDRELVYADLITACCARKTRNASRRLLPLASGLSVDDWKPALAKGHFPIELWPAQRRLCEAGLLLGRSAVVQMPTSAGKTKATELIIRSAFLSGRTSLAVIVAPFRALCHDIRGDLSKAFAGEDIALDEVSESYRFDIELEEILAQSTVLIVTPEKLLFMLRQAPEIAARIGLIIYDEGHQFDGLARGPTYELLLATLRMTLAAEAQVLLISAVIGNAADVAGWLIKDPEAVVGGDGLLPTIKSIAFASWEHQLGQLKYVQPEDPDEEEYFVPRVINQLPLEKLSKRERNQRVFPEKGDGESQEIGLFLGLNLVPNGSVALFCGQKTSVTKLCRRAVEIFKRKVELERPVDSAKPAQVAKLAALIGRHLGANAASAEAAVLGFFGHHANTPHGVKLAIEHAMKEGDANFVICTSTLAQGVNFPLRYLIVTTTQQGRERIMVRDFHNLMGRAGRAGMHTEGSVIFSSPNIYDEKNVPGRRWRWDAAKALLDPANSEPCRSSILDLFDDYDQRDPVIVLTLRADWLDLAFADKDHIEQLVENVVAAFPLVVRSEFRDFVRGRARAVQNIAAYLAEHVDFADENVGSRVEELAANTLAYHLANEPTRLKLLEVFRATAAAIRDRADAEFRLLIRRSPLPPSDLAELKVWFTENVDALNAARAEGTLLGALYDQLAPRVAAKSLAAIPNRDLAIKVLQLWISGRPYFEILKPLSDEGLRIGRDHVTVEHVVDLCESAFGYDLAMIIASASDLLVAIDEDLAEATDTLHRWVKHGLSDTASTAFMDAGFADRIVSSALGAAFPGALDRNTARQVCRSRVAEVDAILAEFPAYFETIATEIRGG